MAMWLEIYTRLTLKSPLMIQERPRSPRLHQSQIKGKYALLDARRINTRIRTDHNRVPLKPYQSRMPRYERCVLGT